MSEVTIHLKRLGKKRLRTVPYRLPAGTTTLRGLITACVEREVGRFNAGREEPSLVAFLSPEEIGEAARAGRVSFGEAINPEPADPDPAAAVATALTAHADGVFLVFVDDDEITDPAADLELTATSTVTFLRLTPLTGTHW